MTFINDTKELFRFPIPGRLQILWAYFKIAVCLHLNIQKKSLRLLGKRVYFPDFGTFYQIFREIFVLNHYYFETKKVDPRIIDVGANIGMASLYFTHLYPFADITAYEPNPALHKYLYANLKNTNVRMKGTALSDKVGKTTLFIDNGAGGGGSTIIDGVKSLKKFREGVEVKTEILPKEKIDLLKIDTEGAEARIVKSLDLSLVGEIVAEVHHSVSNSLKEVSGVLKGLTVRDEEENHVVIHWKS